MRWPICFWTLCPTTPIATPAMPCRPGLPVLTCKGTAYTGRVAASMLEAAVLPELVTENAQTMKASPLALARDPVRLKTLRDKLARRTSPLFDTPRFTRDLEALQHDQRSEDLIFSPHRPILVGRCCPNCCGCRSAHRPPRRRFQLPGKKAGHARTPGGRRRCLPQPWSPPEPPRQCLGTCLPHLATTRHRPETGYHRPGH